MKKYVVFDIQTDEVIGEVEANDVVTAEIIASREFDRYSDEIYAFSKENMLG